MPAEIKLWGLGRQFFRAMQEVTDHEEEAHDNEGNSDHGGGLKASRERVRPTVIEAVNIRRTRKPDEGDQDAADKFMIPGNDQEDDQHQRGDHVQQKGDDLLPEAESLRKDIEGEQADKGDG